MTVQQAKDMLNDYLNWCPDCTEYEHSSNRKDCDHCMCKAVLIASYCMDKQIESKVRNKHTLGNCDPYTYGYCPACGNPINYEMQYCDNCGQKIDWSKENV